MGIFSSKKKIVVGTSSSRLVEDDFLPNSQVKGLLKAILQEGDIPPYLLDELSNNIGARAERMYAYADRAYPFGLPTGEFISGNVGRAQLIEVLEALEGATVSIDYNVLCPPNILHIGWLKLVRDHGYNPTNNRLGALSTVKGTDVYLDKMEVVLPAALVGTYDPGSVSQWGSSTLSGYSPTRPAQEYAPGLAAFAADTPVVVSSGATEDHARVTAAWYGPDLITDLDTGVITRQLLTETFLIGNTEYSDNEDYFHVKYTVGGVVKYWMYRLGAGTYPTLDSLFDTPAQVSGEFFPFVHFRSNGAGLVDASDEFRASVKMSKYLGIDYADLLGKIEENPDIAQIHDAYLSFVVPARSEDQLELRYLFDFFAQLFNAGQGGQGGVSATQYPTFLAQLGDNRPDSLIHIRDTETKVSLANTGIYRRRITGSIGEVGTHACIFEMLNRDRPVVGPEAPYIARLLLARPISSHTYRRQVTPNVYEEVQVLGLTMRYEVSGDYWTSSDEEVDVLLIPLDRSITRDYRIQEREVLYARSLHLIFNSLQVVTVKWYQRAGWATLMKVVAIVMLIISLGQAIKEAMAVWAAASSLSAAAWAAFTVLLENIVSSYIISQAFVLFVKTVGVDLAVVLAVIAAVTGAFQMLEPGSLKNALPSAKSLLQVATGLAKGAGTVTQGLLQDLAQEASRFEQEMQDQLKLLEKANELLQTNNLLEPFTIFGEHPQDYYRRTIHSGNVGTIGFEALHNYVETALTLPTISETLGGPFDAEYA